MGHCGGALPKRVIVCSLAMVLMAVAELTGAVIWVSSTGLEMMNDQLALTYARSPSSWDWWAMGL